MKMATYFLLIALLLAPASALATVRGDGMHSGSGQHMKVPNYQADKNAINEMMRYLNQLQGRSSLTPEHQREIQQMMDQLGDMRQQMGRPEGVHMQGHCQRQLRDMQRRLNFITSQLQK